MVKMIAGAENTLKVIMEGTLEEMGK